jgi:hypothetical protein
VCSKKPKMAARYSNRRCEAESTITFNKTDNRKTVPIPEERGMYTT